MMSPIYIASIISLFAGSILGLAIFWILVKHGKDKASIHFLAVLGLAASSWSVLNALESFAMEVSKKILLSNGIYLSAVSIPVLIFFLGLCQTEQYRSKTAKEINRRFLLLWLLPAATLIILFMDHHWGLMRAEVISIENRGLIGIEITYGLWFWIHTAYSYTLLTLGLYLIVKTELARKKELIKKILLILGVTVPWALNAVYLFQWPLYLPVDMTPFGLVISTAIFTLLLVRFGYLDLVPEAGKLFLKISPNPLFILDSNDDLIYFNDSCEQLVGLGNDDLGKAVANIKNDWEPLENNKIVRIESNSHSRIYQIKSKEIEKRRCIIGRIVTFSDITDIHHQAEVLQQEVSKKEDDLSAILNSIGDALVATDMNSIIINMNPRAMEMTGLDKLPVGKPLNSVLSIIESESGKLIQNPIDTILANGRVSNIKGHLLLRTANGREYPISLTGSPIVSEGKSPQGVVMVFRDVTEEMKLRELLLQKEKMLSVGGLAAGMAHEINNPLAGIMMSADLLRNRLGRMRNTSANVKIAKESGTTLESIELYMDKRGIFRIVDSIKEAGQKAAHIIDDMVRFSQSGDQIQRLCNIIEIFEKSVTAFNRDHGSNEIDILHDFEKDLPDLSCVASQIELVFHNILLNGAQAMIDNRVENPRLSIKIFQSHDRQYLHIEIQDNGPGMSAETRKRAFEPFFSTKPVGSGTGLGLSISYFIIKSHNGDMRIESDSRISIRLPI